MGVLRTRQRGLIRVVMVSTAVRRHWLRPASSDGSAESSALHFSLLCNAAVRGVVRCGVRRWLI